MPIIAADEKQSNKKHQNNCRFGYSIDKNNYFGYHFLKYNHIKCIKAELKTLFISYAIIRL